MRQQSSRFRDWFSYSSFSSSIIITSSSYSSSSSSSSSFFIIITSSYSSSSSFIIITSSSYSSSSSFIIITSSSSSSSSALCLSGLFQFTIHLCSWPCRTFCTTFLLKNRSICLPTAWPTRKHKLRRDADILAYTKLDSKTVKKKSKVHPRTGHEGPEGE
jgi:hypothetical protein